MSLPSGTSSSSSSQFWCYSLLAGDGQLWQLPCARATVLLWRKVPKPVQTSSLFCTFWMSALHLVHLHPPARVRMDRRAYTQPGLKSTLLPALPREEVKVDVSEAVEKATALAFACHYNRSGGEWSRQLGLSGRFYAWTLCVFKVRVLLFPNSGQNWERTGL